MLARYNPTLFEHRGWELSTRCIFTFGSYHSRKTSKVAFALAVQATESGAGGGGGALKKTWFVLG